MIITVPDKRERSHSGIPAGSSSPPSPLTPTRTSPLGPTPVLGKTVHVDSWCKVAGGYETVPGEIRGRLLKIFYARTQKNGRVGAEHNLCALALTHPVH
jgi:hypothetical protein